MTLTLHSRKTNIQHFHFQHFKNNVKTMKKDNFVRQAARWVARMFGYKAENMFARGLWYVFATSATIVALFVAFICICETVDDIQSIHWRKKHKRQENDVTYLHGSSNTYISPSVIHHKGYSSYLYNTVEGKRTITEIQGICQSTNDSLTCYYKDNKCGYFNKFTGEAVIPAKYDKAWAFSEGVAWVMEKGQLHLIDHDGKDVLGKALPYSEKIDSYCFHNGMCAMTNREGRIGLINKQGEWTIAPSYSSINYNSHGYWAVIDTLENHGAFNLDGAVMLPFEFNHMRSNDYDNYIYARRLNHTDQVFDFKGNLVNACSFENVECLEYESDEFEYQDYMEGYERRPLSANCKAYQSSDYHFGLMDKDGNIITPPLYDNIRAIAKDRYFCEGDGGSVILDDKGKECGEKL